MTSEQASTKARNVRVNADEHGYKAFVFARWYILLLLSLKSINFCRNKRDGYKRILHITPLPLFSVIIIVVLELMLTTVKLR